MEVLFESLIEVLTSVEHLVFLWSIFNPFEQVKQAKFLTLTQKRAVKL
jgi:hypothetical protein